MSAQPGFEWITFTTDYGTRDGFVAACKGVLAVRAPSVKVLDVTHEIPPQAVTAGAAVLEQTVSYLPTAVHLVVVDPGVGTHRRGLAVATDRGVLVGPDNGVLLPAADKLGGVRQAYALDDPQWWLPQRSHTFHGRDVFAPVAAALANGTTPDRLGAAVAVEDLVAPTRQGFSVNGNQVRSEVVTIDHFGNLQLAGEQAPWPLGTALQVHCGDSAVRARFTSTFADVGEQECLVLVDSSDKLAVAVNCGSAAERIGAHRNDIVHIEPAEN